MIPLGFVFIWSCLLFGLVHATTGLTASTTDRDHLFLNTHDNTKPRPSEAHACWKNADFRGFGKAASMQSECTDPNFPDMSFGRCFPPCESSATQEGYGTFCLQKCTTVPQYKASQSFYCCQTKEVCDSLQADLNEKLPSSLAKLARDFASNPIGVFRIVADLQQIYRDLAEFSFPVCKKLPHQRNLDSVLRS
jgi:hypothetical protein